ncbi:capsular exopolysaccharide family [Granulicella rosea]|uniref:Capsular exopolysaccharide family n=1 Tax=Granulicella rosea TaxID=474952 RepID=A0A239HDF6_9BACT|nr:polysaccharide biosynthesis tyrosine autokinase [Granulicella rosea]SNS79427.1 capsular exopolysaccharide family [Granulicella rosea]
MPGSIPQAADASLADALLTLRKRRWVLIVAFVLGAAFGLYRAFFQPRIFEAYGRIQVRTGSADQYKLTSPVGLGQDTMTQMMTETAILQSDTLLLTVAKDLDLCNNPAFLGRKTAPEPRRDLNDPQVRQGTLLVLSSNLKIAMQPRTNILRLSYSSLDGKLSAEIVNTVISEYIQRSYETRFASTQRVSKWLSKQLEDLKADVEASQEKMINLQRRLGILGFDPTHNQISTSLDDLAKASGQAKLARIIAESRYRMLSGMEPDAIEGSIDAGPGLPPSGLNALRTQLSTARSTYAEQEATLGPNHPQAKSTKAQIDELARQVAAEQNRLLLQSKENYLIAQANEEKTNAALDAQKADAYKLRDDLVEYTLRQREFESNRTLYEGLLQRLRTAGIQAGLESLEIDIVDQAVPPASPMLRPKSTLVLTTLAVAMILGVLIAFLLDTLDTGIRSVTELEAITEMPSLAVIPRLRKPAGAAVPDTSPLPVISQPKSQFTESFRALRTALLLSTAGREPKLLMFTSAAPGEGKTTTSINLAAILAQRGARVLLIDADLRRPAVHVRLGLEGRLGLSTYLSGSSTLEESLQHLDELPSLDILTSGPVPPFPTELVSSTAMRELLRYAGEIYTHVVIDSPPILSVTDGVELGGMVDAVILVLRHGKSNKHVVRRARDLLVRSNCPLKGIVLNAVDLSAPEYESYYGYSGDGYANLDNGWSASFRGKNGRKNRTKGDQA